MGGTAGQAIELLECVLCHRVHPDVAVGVIRYELVPGQFTFDSDPRCKDHIACQEAALRTGLPWLVADEWKPERDGMIRR